MLGAAVNCLAVMAGGGLGLLFKKGIPQRIATTIMSGLALCVFYIGISGLSSGKSILVIVLSVVLGAFLGEWIDLDKRINLLGDFLQARLKSNEEGTSFSKGFITASLLFCVGSMAVVGALQSGLSGDNSTLFAKSLIDGISAVIFASTLGVGVLFSGILLLVYEGGIALLAHVVSPLLSTAVVGEMTCVGSLLIIGIAFNMLGITRLKVMNYVPAVFLPMALCLFIK